TVKNATFISKDKAAVLVTSTAGADIVWGEGNDISGVAADTEFAVWVDEDRAAYDDLVTVTGCYKKIEGTNATIVTNAEQLTQALVDKKNVICLQSGVYEGTFKPTVATKFVGASEVVIKGRVNIDGYGDGSSFENIKFEINDASKVKNSFTGTNYKYPAIVVIYASGVKFENCEFACDINTGVCGINYAAHATGKKLVVNNCSFKGDFYAIRTRTLFEITNSKFDIHTDAGTLAAVWTWGNGNPWANEVTFTGNTNINANEVYGVQMTSTTFTYNNIAFNVQGNTGFYALADATSSTCTYKDNTFAAGSETF
ncbi:MAG: hypothetical protein IKB03_02020, partial [Tidjanibacter sp.]|nr:hypothetical protein [Tidjanibacter sp.]